MKAELRTYLLQGMRQQNFPFCVTSRKVLIGKLK